MADVWYRIESNSGEHATVTNLLTDERFEMQRSQEWTPAEFKEALRTGERYVLNDAALAMIEPRSTRQSTDRRNR